MTLTSRQRAALRAQAHHLRATVHVGHGGVTDAARRSLDDALRSKELVKVQFAKNAGVETKPAANALATLVGAEVVQTIGRVAVVFRPRPAD